MTTLEAATGSRARTDAGRRAASRRRLGGGVTWILVVAALLAGVVAVNVLVLKLNVELDRLGSERAQLKADNAALRARLSSAASSLRVSQEARRRLGLVPADPLLTDYVRIGPGEK
jgi:cell division protein FtsL